MFSLLPLLVARSPPWCAAGLGCPVRSLSGLLSTVCWQVPPRGVGASRPNRRKHFSATVHQIVIYHVHAVAHCQRVDTTALKGRARVRWLRGGRTRLNGNTATSMSAPKGYASTSPLETAGTEQNSALARTATSMRGEIGACCGAGACVVSAVVS